MIPTDRANVVVTAILQIVGRALRPIRRYAPSWPSFWPTRSTPPCAKPSTKFVARTSSSRRSCRHETATEKEPTHG